MKTYVLYHSDKDGQGAAYAAWKKLGDEATYIPVNYHETTPLLDSDSRVFIVDFSYGKFELEMLAKKMHQVVVIDHHKTAADTLYELMTSTDYPNLEIHFDMEKAGCVMAWEYFHTGREVPLLLKYIQDRDLWKFELDATKAVHEYLCSRPFKFENWDSLVDDTGLFITAIKAGKAILRAMEKAVRDICRNAFTMEIGGHKAVVVNTGFRVSEVCNYLLDHKDELGFEDCVFSVAYNDVSATLKKFDLRSKGDFDVSEVAKKFGGGGHKNAAGFHINIDRMDL